MIELAERCDGVVLPVRAQPGARREGIVGEHAGAIKVAVTARPERGKANHAVIEVLCKQLGLRRPQVTLVAGETSRNKRVLVTGVAAAELRERLQAVLAQGKTER